MKYRKDFYGICPWLTPGAGGGGRGGTVILIPIGKLKGRSPDCHQRKYRNIFRQYNLKDHKQSTTENKYGLNDKKSSGSLFIIIFHIS